MGEYSQNPEAELAAMIVGILIAGGVIIATSAGIVWAAVFLVRLAIQ